MTTIDQSTDLEDPALSPWWVRAVLIVMVLGFSGLIAVTVAGLSQRAADTCASDWG